MAPFNHAIVIVIDYTIEVYTSMIILYDCMYLFKIDVIVNELRACCNWKRYSITINYSNVLYAQIIFLFTVQ